jgi:hypothetical protein
MNFLKRGLGAAVLALAAAASVAGYSNPILYKVVV